MELLADGLYISNVFKPFFKSRRKSVVNCSVQAVIRRMVLCQTNNQAARTIKHTTWKIDNRITHCLHPLADPRLAQCLTFQYRIQVMSKHQDPPPGSILTKISRRKPAARQIMLHHGMNLLALAAALMLPVDQLLSVPVHVRYDTKQLVALVLQSYRLKRQCRLRVQPRKC